MNSNYYFGFQKAHIHVLQMLRKMIISFMGAFMIFYNYQKERKSPSSCSIFLTLYISDDFTL